MLNGVRAAVGRTARPRAMRHCPLLLRQCIELANPTVCFAPDRLPATAAEDPPNRTRRWAQRPSHAAARAALCAAAGTCCASCAPHRTCSPDAGRPQERQRCPPRRCWMRHTPRLETRRSVRLCDTARSCVSSAWSNVSRCAAAPADVCVGQTLCYRVARASSLLSISAAVGLCSRRQVGDGAVLSLALHGRALRKLNVSFCSLSEAAIFELVQVAVHRVRVMLGVRHGRVGCKVAVAAGMRPAPLTQHLRMRQPEHASAHGAHGHDERARAAHGGCATEARRAPLALK